MCPQRHDQLPETDPADNDAVKRDAIELARQLCALRQECEVLQAEVKRLSDLNSRREVFAAKRIFEIERLLQQKNDMLVQFNHDLRTPLAPLVSMIPLLLEGELDSKKSRLVLMIKENIEYLQALVNKHLQLARTSSPQFTLDLQTINLSAMVRRSLLAVRYSGCPTTTRLSQHVPEDLLVRADPLRLKVVLDNLITNAVKFTPAGGAVEINCLPHGEWVVISVADNGRGMNSEQIARVLDDFYIARDVNAACSSVGLGLPMSRRIIERHGGKIWLQSDGPNQGTTVCFTLPRTSFCTPEPTPPAKTSD